MVLRPKLYYFHFSQKMKLINSCYKTDVDYFCNSEQSYCCFEDEDIKINDTVEKYLICSVCYGLPRQPQVGSCGHILCRACYLQTFQDQNPKMCPVCRGIGSWTNSQPDFYIGSIHLRLYTEFTDVKCGNGCGFHGPVPRVVDHEKQHCPKRYLLCPFRNCPFLGPAHLVEKEHKNECKFALDVCSMCLTPQLVHGTHNCLDESIKERHRMCFLKN